MSPRPPLVDFALRHARVTAGLCTRQVRETGYTLEHRVLSDTNLIFVTRGRVAWVIDGKPCELKPGGLVIVRPELPHHAFSRTKRVTLLSIHVDAALPGRQDVFDLLVPPRLQEVVAGSRLDQYLRGALDEYERPDIADAKRMLRSWSRLVVLELLSDNSRRGLLEVRSPDPLVAELLDELDRRVGKPTALADLARVAGYSPQHLNRTFRRVLGVTPLQHLTALRMDRAADLLLDSHLTVAAVGARVGYDDPAYFSRVFKQHRGASPADYRAAAGSDYPTHRSTPPFPR